MGFYLDQKIATTTTAQDAEYQAWRAQDELQYQEGSRENISTQLGGAAQLSGSLAPEGPRIDTSKYSQGLRISSAKGDTTNAMRDLAMRTAQYDKKRASLLAKQQGAKTPKQAEKLGQKIGALDAAKQPIADWYRSVEQANELYAQANKAAQAGDFTTADQLIAQADAISEQISTATGGVEGYKLNKNKLGAEKGQMFDPVASPTEGEGNAALSSPTGMLVGGMVNEARQMMDPASESAVRFRDSLTSGALAAVDAAKTNAVRALATEERGAGRAMRDMMLSGGQASQTGKMAAVAARTAERFATQKATIETEAGAQRAQILGEAAQAYEQFRVQLANNATELASSWVNDQSGMRDSFMQLNAQVMTSVMEQLFGRAGQVLQSATSLQQAKIEKRVRRKEAHGKAWSSGANTGMSMAGSAMCWVAEVLFGVFSQTTADARLWANTHDNWFTRLYRRFGLTWAAWLLKNRWAHPLVKPIWLAMAVAGRKQRESIRVR